MPAFFAFDSFRRDVLLGRLDLSGDEIKLALIQGTAPTDYSAWTADGSVVAGTIVTPATRNGRRYIATIGGTSGSSEPAWPKTAGETVLDGSVTWQEYGGDISHYSTLNDLATHEVPVGSPGYTALGKALTNISLTLEGTTVKWAADDVLWTGLTATFRYGVLYANKTVDAIAYPAIGYIVFDDTAFADKSVSAVDFLVQWSDLGIMTLGRGVL